MPSTSPTWWLLVLLWTLSDLPATAQQWQAAEAFGDMDFTGWGSSLAGVVSDGQGNTYVSGSFRGVSMFRGQLLASAGKSDGFLAKLDAQGNVAWLRTVGGRSADGMGAPVLGPQGHVYVAGTFGPGASAMGQPFDPDSLTAWGAYVASYDGLTGFQDWFDVMQSAPNYNCYPSGVGVSTRGECYVLISGFAMNQTIGGFPVTFPPKSA